MAKRKTSSELLDEKKKAREVLEKKINQLKEEERRLIAKVKQEQKKEEMKNRMKLANLIYEKLGRDFAEGDIKRLSEFIDGQEARGSWFSKAMNEGLDHASPEDTNSAPAQTTAPDTSVSTE